MPVTKINIDASKIDNQERLDKVIRMQQEMHTVLNSKVFMDRVLRMNKSGERSKWKDATNMEVYKHLMGGSEVLSPGIDHEWDIIIDDPWSWKGVIGWTYPSKPTIYQNSKFFDRRSTKHSGSNLVHEQGHKLGFKHDFRNTRSRPFSICYQLNIAYEEAYDIIFSKPVHKVLVCHRPWRYLKLREVCYWTETYE